LNYLLEHDSDKEEWYLDNLDGFAIDEDASDWYFNENCKFDSLYMHVSNPLSDICVDGNPSPRSLLEALRPLHVPLSTSLVTDRFVEHIDGAFFKVPARRRKQKPLYFGRCRNNVGTYALADFKSYTPEFS